MIGKTNAKSLNGKPAQTKARASRKGSKLKTTNKKTKQVPTREVVLEDGTVGVLSLYKAQRGKKRFTKEERELIAATRAVLEVLEKQEKEAGQETTEPEKTTNSIDRTKLSHYKARPNKKHYTKDELERIAATRAVLEVLEHQEKLFP